MDDCGGIPHKGLIAIVRKKRSQTPRRPRRGNLTATGSHDQSPLASHYSISRDSSASRFRGDYSRKRQEDGKPKKLKSKVGGATNICQTKNSSYGSSGSLLFSKSVHPSDVCQPRENLIPKDKSSEGSPPSDKKSGLKGISCKDFSRATFGASKSDVEKKPKKNVLKKQGEKRRENLKIQRRPRRRLILNELDEDEDDDEIHYSEKLKLKANKNEMLEDVGSSGKEVKRISKQGFDQYTDYEEQLLSDDKEEEHVTCGAPFCVNPYKYRASKLNLPLCSIRCYKATR